MNFYKKLVGDTIYLSPRTAEAAEIFTEWLNDFQVTDYIGRSFQTLSLKQELEYFEENLSNESNFFIVTLDGDKVIGTIGFNNVDHINRAATLGIFIGDKDYREKGIGTEAVRLLLDFGFNYLNLHNINLTVMDFNLRAQKCYLKCGFKEVGRTRENRYINGKYYDTISMDILDSEFNESYIRNKNIGANNEGK